MRKLNIRDALLLCASSLAFLTLAITAVSIWHFLIIPGIDHNASGMLSESVKAMRTRISDPFTRAEQSLAAERTWIQTELRGALAQAELALLAKRAIAQLGANPLVDSIHIGLDTGREVVIRREAGEGDGNQGFSLRITDPASPTRRATLQSLALDGRVISSNTHAAEFDAREHDWFKGAMSLGAEGGRYWSQPYPFLGSGQPGIAVSTRAQSRDGRRYVIAFELRLAALSKDLATARMTTRGGMAIVSAAGQSIAVAGLHSGQTRADGHEPQLEPVESSHAGTVIPHIWNAVRGQAQTTGRQIEIGFRGEQWYAHYAPLFPGDGRAIWMIAYAPRADFAGWLHDSQDKFYYLAGFLVALSFLLAGVASRWISLPFSRLLQTAQSFARGEFTARFAETGPADLQLLGTALNTVGARVDEHDREIRLLNADLARRVSSRSAELLALYDALPLVVFATDRAGTITACNAAAERAFGISGGAIIGKSCLSLPILSEKRRRAMQADIMAALGDDKQRTQEFWINYPGGARRFVRYSTSKFSLEDGTPAGLVGVVEDLTALKLATGSLLEEQARLSSQQVTLTQLIGATTIPGDATQAAYRMLTEAAALEIDVERASIWRMAAAGDALLCIDLFERSTGRHSSAERIDRTDFPDYLAALDSEQLIVADNCAADPRIKAVTERVPQERRAAATLYVPIHTQGKLAGVLCLAHLGRERSWSAENRLFAVSLASIGRLWLESEERGRAETRLAESESRNRRLNELLTDWDWGQDEQFRFTHVSTPRSGHLSFVPGDLLGKTLWDALSSDLSEQDWQAHRAKLMRHEPFHDFRISRLGPSGEKHWLSVSGVPEHDELGRFAGYRGTGTDRGRVLPAELELRLANERLERALESSHVSLWESDISAGTIFLSDGWSRLLGEPPAPTYTTFRQLASLMHKDELDAVTRAQTDTIKGITSEYAIEHRIRDSNGAWKWVLSLGRVTERDPVTRRALRMSGTNLDITERVRSEEVLRLQTERL